MVAGLLVFPLVTGCASSGGGTAAELRADNARLRGRVAALEARLAEAGLPVELAEGPSADGPAMAWGGEPGEAEDEVAALRKRNRRLERLAGLTPMDDAAAAEAARIRAVRDRATERVTVWSRPVPVDFEGFNLATPHAVSFGYDESMGGGSEGAGGAAGPGPVRMVVKMYRSRSRPYRGVGTVELTLDGRDTLSLPVTGYETVATYPPPPGSRLGSTRYDDELTVLIDDAAALKITHADAAIVLINGTALPLSREHLAIFRAVAERRAMQSAAATLEAATPEAVIPGAGAAGE